MQMSVCCLGTVWFVAVSCVAQATESPLEPVSAHGLAGATQDEATDTGKEQDPGPAVWGEEGPWEPEYYPAPDVPESQVDLIRAAHATASKAWGNYGPLEYWIIGNDLEAATEHDVYYCAVRREKDPALPAAFAGHCLDRGHNFKDYARDGGAGLNTRRSEYEDYSVLIVTFATRNPSPRESDYTVVAYHEYFHVVQHAQVQTRNEDERRRLMVANPWWSEGGAEYMAQLLYSRQPGVDEGYLRERMRWKMRSKSKLAEGERFYDIPYGERAHAAYDLGTWFIAFLIDRVGEEAYRVDFYDDLEELGWEGSFQANFGTSSKQMLAEFEVFLDAPLEEQMAIIPASAQGRP